MKITARYLRSRIIIIFIALLIMGVYTILRISCPFSAIFHIPCPTCGMTRSAIALLRGDFRLSLEYNPCTVLVISALAIALFRDIIPLKKRTMDIILISLSSVVFIVYIVRLVLFLNSGHIHG